jgi:hypothetical protein
MQKILVKLLILGALAFSTTTVFAEKSVQFDGGGPIPTCIPNTPNCQQPGR